MSHGDTRLSCKTQHQRYLILDKSASIASCAQSAAGGTGVLLLLNIAMTREEFARRWLKPAIGATRDPPPAVRRIRLTEAPSRTFREKAPQPSRLLRVGRFLKQWAMIGVAGAILFAGMAVVVLKLAPYITDYAATYLVY